MKRNDLEYDLPSELIAQQPAEPRDASRLLVLHRDTGRIEHRAFHDIVDYLDERDCLVLNNTRVIPARFYCRRATGGRIEGLFLHEVGDAWRVLLKPAARIRPGERLDCEGAQASIIVAGRLERGEFLVRPVPTQTPLEFLEQVGHTPLPPYIRRGSPASDAEASDVVRYQTVYADRPGAVAAPTAGLHFTQAVFERLAERRVERVEVTLHVGVGTFAPIQVERLADHPMHAEWYDVSADAIEKLRRMRAEGRRLVAVGTTSVRVLESLPAGLLNESGASTAEGESEREIAGEPPCRQTGWTDIFIYPPYAFRHVDRLITNFHLPGSTLIALVMAFANPDQIRTAYAAAITERYRFYSYGDAMLIV